MCLMRISQAQATGSPTEHDFGVTCGWRVMRMMPVSHMCSLGSSTAATCMDVGKGEPPSVGGQRQGTCGWGQTAGPVRQQQQQCHHHQTGWPQPTPVCEP